MNKGLSVDERELLEAACAARSNAYAWYSGVAIGAAVRSTTGRVYAGCNVENTSYGLSMCAERVAIFKAVGDGDIEITQLALFADGLGSVHPCGACRQVLEEFSKDAQIIISGPHGETKVFGIRELFPQPFRLEDS